MNRECAYRYVLLLYVFGYVLIFMVYDCRRYQFQLKAYFEIDAYFMFCKIEADWTNVSTSQ